MTGADWFPYLVSLERTTNWNAPKRWPPGLLGFPPSEENWHEESTIHRWRKQYAGMAVSDVRELKRLQDENARLKKLLAERDLEVEVMKEIRAKKW